MVLYYELFADFVERNSYELQLLQPSSEFTEMATYESYANEAKYFDSEW